jgi:hypothetical protein
MAAPTRIAFVARRKSGKSTAADLLIERGYTRLSLADPVKDAAVDMLNHFWYLHLHGKRDIFTRDEINANKAAFRPLLEWVGTTFGRDYLGTPDRWIRLFEKRLNEIDGPVVCDDMRLPNEANELRDMGFTIVKIVRPELDRLEALLQAGEPSGLMPSEMNLDDIQPDHIIYNDGSLAYLQMQVGLLVDAWKAEAS